MKKIIIITTLFLLSFLVACGTITTNSTTQTTNQPTTVSSSNTTLEPSTQAPTTIPPTTQEPTTQAPTTLPPTTVPPTTLPPTTVAPTTQPPTTLPPTTTTTTTTYDRYQDIYLLSVNDFHGGAYNGFLSFARISAKVKQMKAQNDYVIAMTNGDMFQGTAISNYFYGRPIIEAMNEAGFDGFVIGNHEFDWGIEKVAQYNDGNELTGQANFPFLVANIVNKNTQELMDFTVPYIIQETNGVKVGIIGVIGNVTRSIAASRFEDFEILDPVMVVEEYSRHLRTVEEVDVVVVYAHSGTSINTEIAYLPNDARVDAIFNGHTHSLDSGSISRSGANLFYAQMNPHSNYLLAQIKLTYDRTTKSIDSGQVKIYTSNELYATDDNTEMILIDYMTREDYVEFVSEVLTVSEGNYFRTELAPWGASVIRDYMGIDFGAVNGGGFRVAMSSGQVTMGHLVTIYPFDNYIKTSKLTGRQIKSFYQQVLWYNIDIYFDDSLSYDGTDLFVNGELIDLDRLYTIGAVDYIFDLNDAFLEGEDITLTPVLMRDLMYQDLINSNNSFNPTNGTNYTLPISHIFNDIRRSII